MINIAERTHNARNSGAGSWLGGLIIAGAVAAAWYLQRRSNSRRVEPQAPRREVVTLSPVEETESIEQASVVVGSFDNADGAVSAARALREEWPYGFQAYSPNLNEAFFEAMLLPQSATRLWIAAGAIIGELGGWATT